ncbi:hypothetical protein HMPREF0293_2226 [Corynebacterium glucuronolyticum ATCC 51866]|uniref:Uncharacterized protein n=1 Tax=Corynebacterium glucuronolyticum ATCC 51866 TaxID=548478 RepID=A0ABM9XMB9_9CORY|nr:hypothetical protein HMPREF0293_2226 [Corynebacterium glucuronolyticum ATCC 51866]
MTELMSTSKSDTATVVFFSCCDQPETIMIEFGTRRSVNIGNINKIIGERADSMSSLFDCVSDIKYRASGTDP